MRLTIELEREVDGRWIADVADLPGVLVYGQTREAALSAAQALALRVLADRLEHSESLPEPLLESVAGLTLPRAAQVTVQMEEIVPAADSTFIRT
ncbi:MAG: type II toxin-antitoxin system HicB family antitoxin [Thermoanaerobaculia bacterium]